jgi:hypothetical protein
MRETTILSNHLGKYWIDERDALNNFFELYELFKRNFLEWLRTFFDNGGRILIDIYLEL